MSLKHFARTPLMGCLGNFLSRIRMRSSRIRGNVSYRNPRIHIDLVFDFIISQIFIFFGVVDESSMRLTALSKVLFNFADSPLFNHLLVFSVLVIRNSL